MKKFMPVEELARDERFNQITQADRMSDARSAVPANAESTRRSSNRLTPARADASDAARSLMHGIFVGEIQALEGAGRTCWDFTTGEEAPFGLKLDMARQAWDEARHVEISLKLGDWMGSDVGQYAENTVLFQAACSNDPVLRLAGVNRALEGLAIDVFTSMKEFGEMAGDPYLEFCEDWMLEFQIIVYKMFSYGGIRSDSDESSLGIARRFRELAGFTSDENEHIADLGLQALEERKAQIREKQAAAKN